MTSKVEVKHDDLGDIEGKSLSTWEVSEKLRQLCPSLLSPPVQMKVTGATVDFVRFVVELGSKADVRRVIKAADSQRIKLSGFPQTLRVRAGDAPIDCPRKHDWDAFFRDAKDMNELVPGERPDTVVISRLPVRWFTRSGSISKFQPDPEVVKEVFQTYGRIRRIDIPILDPCQNPQLLVEMGLSHDAAKAFLTDLHPSSSETLIPTSSANNYNGFGKIAPSTIKPLFSDESSHASLDSSFPLTFTAFIQYAEYAGFAAAMEALRGKKLIYAPNDKNNANSPRFFSAEMKVDFDRNKHLSDLSVRRRKAARIQLEAAAAAAAAEAKEFARREAEAAAAAEEEARRQRAEREARELAAEAQLAAKRAKAAEEEAKKEQLLHALAKRIKKERAKRVKDEVDHPMANHEKKRHRKHHHKEESVAKKLKESPSVSTTSIAIQTSPKIRHSSKRHQTVSEMRDRSPTEDDAKRMRKKLLEKRELQLRAQLLSRLNRRSSVTECL